MIAGQGISGVLYKLMQLFLAVTSGYIREFYSAILLDEVRFGSIGG